MLEPTKLTLRANLLSFHKHALNMGKPFLQDADSINVAEGVLHLKLGKKSEEIKVSRREFLGIRPLRNPNLKWDKNEDEEVTVYIPYKKGGPIRSFFSKFHEIPEERKIQLDKVGSHVWSLCDGNHTVEEIADIIREQYKLVIEEAEAALQTYFNQLIRRRLLGFILPKETEACFEEQLRRFKDI